MENKYIALLCLDFPYPTNGNIFWMGVLRQHQRKSIGQRLVQHASEHAREQGAQTMTVETLAPQEAKESYLNTYKFYESCGFRPLFNLKPEGYKWEMVYMMKNLPIE